MQKDFLFSSSLSYLKKNKENRGKEDKVKVDNSAEIKEERGKLEETFQNQEEGMWKERGEERKEKSISLVKIAV